MQPDPKPSSWKTSLVARVRSRGVMLVFLGLGMAVIAGKLFWPESAPIKIAAAIAPSLKAKTPTTNESLARPTKKLRSSSTLPATHPSATQPNASVLPTTNRAVATTSPAPIAIATPSTRPASIDALGSVFVDESNGYSMRFPSGWPVRLFSGETWVLDCGDAERGLISIGFSPFPTGVEGASIPPEWIARRIKKRPDMVLHAQGYSMIAGKKALWSKSTGPLPMTHASPRMTRVNYILPLPDGRALELRVAASPEQFDALVPVMKQAVETFKLLPRKTQPVASTR